MKNILITLFIITLSTFASEEDLLPWKDFSIGLGKHPKTGEITVTGTLGRLGYTKLTVSCFGKTREIQGKILAKLVLFSPHTMTATHSTGYEQLGGHTLYLKFTRLLADVKGNRTTQRAVLSLPENGEPTIRVELVESEKTLHTASDWKVESVVAEPYKHSSKKGAMKITVKIRNISEKIQIVSESPYPSLKGYARAASYILKDGETYKELLSRNPYSHFLAHNSGYALKLDKMNVPPNSVISMVMYDNVKYSNKTLSLHINISGKDGDPISKETFIKNILIPELTKMKK